MYNSCDCRLAYEVFILVIQMNVQELNLKTSLQEKALEENAFVMSVVCFMVYVYFLIP